MNKREILNLISAFAVVALIVGIIITAFAEENTGAGDAGRLLVIISFIITAVCQIIIWITIRKRRKR